MHTGEYPHRHISRVITNKHLVDFKYRPEAFGKDIGGDMRQVEIDLIFAADPVAFETTLANLPLRPPTTE